ncbi:DNA primase, partial [Enterobacter hormaechei subsp. steigerwaltii]|nr:DNA primase [Enterobacter hormaechei subsp. steigerwaltii]MCC9406871.1 DNA primase [Enterobacter hormaechei subsp. steigerwaltii]MCU2304676.1 DNA primase [Enterobacter hormaechei subsp. steigerwaltii]MCU2314844.1 DNA primase [Enterobacter hormaechei subsp. steigerwaltii]MCU2319932.1 DNA primase [Enterobacter hormaechei subsp. steigerwaltii]
CGAREAAELVAEAMALPMPEPKPAREKPQTDIAGKVAALTAKSSPGQSAYLTSKGLQCPFPMLSDGSLLLVLKNGASATTGAQV